MPIWWWAGWHRWECCEILKILKIEHQVESVLGALETELLNGQPEVNKIAALRWNKNRQQSAGNDDNADTKMASCGHKFARQCGRCIISGLHLTKLHLSLLHLVLLHLFCCIFICCISLCYIFLCCIFLCCIFLCCSSKHYYASSSMPVAAPECQRQQKYAKCRSCILVEVVALCFQWQ